MARNDLTQELRHISYRQISQVRVSDLGGRKNEARSPVLGGPLANDIEEPRIIRDKPGC